MFSPFLCLGRLKILVKLKTIWLHHRKASRPGHRTFYENFGCKTFSGAMQSHPRRKKKTSPQSSVLWTDTPTPKSRFHKLPLYATSLFVFFFLLFFISLQPRYVEIYKFLGYKFIAYALCMSLLNNCIRLIFYFFYINIWVVNESCFYNMKL